MVGRAHPRQHRDRTHVLLCGAAGLLWVLLLAGCGTTQVAVKPDFPEPVMVKQPATVGLYLAPALVNKVHTETLPNGHEWQFDLGAANAALFRQVAQGMFDDVVMLDQPRAESGVTLVIRPQMQKFEFSTPKQSRTDYYEAWIKYRLHVTGANGKPVAVIPITAYGRSPKHFMHGADAMADAANRAMRDAAAAIAVKLPRQAAVQAYLHGSPTSAGPQTAQDGHNGSTD